jgi:MFS transporter, Spinster family, sphingosine-1-phosphate transporter
VIKRPGAILALLTGLNLLNYIDRFIVSAVLPAMTPELGLSKFVGGLLATVFLVGYSVTSPVFGSLGDRRPRKMLIAVGVTLWSAATVASGLATGPITLLVARALVGVGEASYATLAPTIIDDIAPPEKRGRWLAVFYVATPVGAALGYLIGGFIEARWGWRNAFLFAGGPGLLLAGVCLLIQEPARKTATDKPNVFRDIGKLLRIPLYRKGVLGYCAYTAAIGAFSHWAPTFLVERYKPNLTLQAANFKFGLITVIGGIVGTVIGGLVADALKRRIRGVEPDTPAYDREEVRTLLRLCATGSLIGAPLALACFLSPSSGAFFTVVTPTEVALFLSTSPINAVLLRSVPQELRASAMALAIFSIHALGDFWSPALVGLLADNMPMHLAMMTLPVLLFASFVLWWPGRSVSERVAHS